MSGLGVLTAIVIVGLLSGAVFYRYQRGRVEARLASEIAEAPKSPDERLALWLTLVGPQIHHRLAVVGRFTPEMPWLVTHAVAAADGGAPELFGIECDALPHDLARREGMTIVVPLPAPHRLGRATLVGERAQRVPLYAADVKLEPVTRLRELALYLLEGIPHALERDVPGATLEIHVASEPAGG